MSARALFKKQMEVKNVKLVKRQVILVVPFVLVLALSVVTLPSHAQRIFTVHLSGDAEVPPTMTLAQGQAVFMLNEDGTAINYILIAANIEYLFMAHIHLAPAGVNGPIVVWLYGSPPPGPDEDLILGRFDGYSPWAQSRRRTLLDL